MLICFQGQDDDIGIVPESLENENGFRSSETNAFIPNSYYMSGVPSWRSDSENAIHRTESDDDDETLVDKRAMPFENKFFGARGKRYGFMSFLPTRYSGWYSRIDTEPSPRKRYHPNMFVSMRGKRLSDAGYRTLEDYFGIPDGKYILLRCYSLFDIN